MLTKQPRPLSKPVGPIVKIPDSVNSEFYYDLKNFRIQRYEINGGIKLTLPGAGTGLNNFKLKMTY